MEESSMRSLITTLALVLVATLSGQKAESKPSYDASLVCGTKIDGLVYKKLLTGNEIPYGNLYSIYRAMDKQSFLISGMKNGCLLRIIMSEPGWDINYMVDPYAGDAILMSLRSRKKALDRLWYIVNRCNDIGEEYIYKLYYAEDFLKVEPLESNPDGESLCFRIVRFGTMSAILSKAGHQVVLDVVAGSAFMGENR
jgi:hypothetical protein